MPEPVPAPEYETPWAYKMRTGEAIFLVCPACGAYVADTDVHDRFHAGTP
jgi:hypothetical protein